MSYSLNTQNTLDSPGTLSPLAGPSERSAYDQLMALVRSQSPSPLSSETPGAATSPNNTPGASFGAPASGNFGQDAMNAGRAMGQTALGMMANPAGIPGSVVGTMIGAAVRGLTNQPNPTTLAAALGPRGALNAVIGAIRGQPTVAQMFGDQQGDKPSALSAQEAQAQMANAAATNDFGGPKSGWGMPGYGGGDKSSVAADGGSKGGTAAAAAAGMASSLGGTAGGGQSGSQDSGGASGANLAVGGLIPFAEGGNIVRGLGSGLDDLVPTTINGRRAAALSDGEFVIPADVVSMMGDGSTDAGARRLYDFMNTVRQHKTGTTEQAGPLPIGDILKRSLR